MSSKIQMSINFVLRNQILPTIIEVNKSKSKKIQPLVYFLLLLYNPQHQ